MLDRNTMLTKTSNYISLFWFYVRSAPLIYGTGTIGRLNLAFVFNCIHKISNLLRPLRSLTKLGNSKIWLITLLYSIKNIRESHRVIPFWFLLNFLFISAFFDILALLTISRVFQAAFQANENPPGLTFPEHYVRGTLLWNYKHISCQWSCLLLLLEVRIH